MVNAETMFVLRHAYRSDEGLLQLIKGYYSCLLLSVIEKHLNEPMKLSHLLHNLTHLLNLFLFISTFSVFLNNYFLR